jgi:hypothetical protein
MEVLSRRKVGGTEGTGDNSIVITGVRAQFRTGRIDCYHYTNSVLRNVEVVLRKFCHRH